MLNEKFRAHKKRLFILLLVTSVLPLTVIALSYINIYSSVLEADSGIINAFSLDMENGPYMLGGEWEVYNYSIGADKPLQELIQKQFVQDVRYMSRMEGLTYRFTIQTDKPNELWLMLPRPHKSKLWINGTRVFSRTNKDITSMDCLPLSDYEVGDSTFDFVLQISGGTPYFGYQGVLVGSYEQLAAIQIRWTVMDILVVGLVLMLIIVCLSLYVNKPTEKYLLLLSLSALLNTAHFMLIPRNPIFAFFSVGSVVFYRIFYFLNYFVCKQFLLSLIPKRVDYYVWGLFGISVASVFVFHQYSVMVLRVTAISYLIIQFYYLAKGVLSDVSGAAILLFGNVIMFANELFYIFIQLNLIPHGFIDVQIMPAQYAFVCYFVTMVIATCMKFARKFSEADKLTFELEERVAEQTGKAREANENVLSIQQNKQRFLMGVVHNLRNPLFALGGYMDLLRDEMANKTTEQLYYLNMIDDKINYLSKMSHNLLLFSRLEEGEIKFHFTEFTLLPILQRAAKDVEAKITNKQVHVLVECEDIQMVADQLCVRQIIDNLLDNAVRFSGDGGTIRIAGEILPKEEAILITVQDNGCGIDPETLSTLFLRNPMNRIGSTTGLGLSIVDALVRAHNGQINVKSKLGEGTTFTITFRTFADEI